MRNTQKGMSLAEVLAGLLILSIMTLATVTATTSALKLSKNNVNKEFGTQKAISMLEELRALVQAQSGTRVTVLDAYDDGIDNKFLLTTQGQLPLPSVTQPGDLISGNIVKGTGWLYERRISVQPVPGQGNDVRFVNVKVFINEDGRQRLLAEVASVLRTLVVDMPPTQVYDVYAVAVENVPGWWVYMSNLVPFVKSTIADLQARNPGLVFRTHWIYTLSYGRDWEYKPYINDSADSRTDIPWAYFYPGKMPADAPSGQANSGQTVGNPFYYPWFLFRGVMSKDGTAANDYLAPTVTPSVTVGNPWPYAIADQYNNAMRYEDELAYYNKRKTADPAEEMTWRLLIEQMYSNPAQFTNAIVINLHGELLPLPPVRNYSDAAKSPEAYPNVRAVTHPEQLRYTNTDPVKLRVYTYRMDPDNAAAGTNYLGESGPDVPVTIKISGTTSWTPAGSDVQIIRGGTNQDATAGADAYDPSPVDAPTSASSNRMYYTTTASGSDVILKLYKSPLKHPQTSTGAGLDSAARLYDLEYIPAPLEDLTQTTTAGQFTSRHLGSTCCTEVAALRDTFSTVSYSQNNGSINWATNWTESNDNGSSSTGHMTVTGNQLQLGDDNDANDSSIYRQADLTAAGFETARLTFTFATQNVDAGKQVILEMSNNGGTSYTTLETFTGPAAGYRVYDISPYIATNTRVRFRVIDYTTTAPRDYFNVDNLQIEGSRLGNLPKNTARWIITIPTARITNNKLLTVETRLGDTVTTGVMYPPASASVPPNLSRTYVWRGSDLWIFGDGTTTNQPNLPITEQFQFLGDPRHMPYADVKRPHQGSGFGANFESRLGMGYNRYFDDFEGNASGDLTAVSLVARDPENYTFNSLSSTFAVLVDGVTNVSVTLPTGAQSAATIATTLNTAPDPDGAGPLPAFSVVAFADVSTSRLRIRSRYNGGSIQYDNVNGNNGAIFGFEGSTIWANTTGVPWPGWRYTAPTDGLSYGVKADGTDTNDNWHNMEIDVPRGFQMLRLGLISSSALWTTMTGYSYYYIGIGNEIGYDAANRFDFSIPISTKPYTGVTGSDWEQTIIDNNGQGCTLGCGVKYIRQQNTTNGWWGLSWIGELYPDSQYAADSIWKDNGNLRTGVGATYYVRDGRDDMPSQFRGNELQRAERRTGPRGCTTLFWGETATSAFHHTGSSGNASILTDGVDIRDNYELPVPDTIPNDRPWQIAWNATGDNPENFLTGAYAAPHRMQLLDRYFQRVGPSGTVPSEASALVAVTEPSLGRPAFIVVNGLSPTGVTGTTFIAKWSFLTLIQSYLNGGLFNDAETYTDPDGIGPLLTPAPARTYHIRQLPRVEITEPNVNTALKAPTSVRIAWTEKWTRWDGKAYTNGYTAGCQNTPAGCYTPPSGYDRKFIVLYSPSNGTPDVANGNPTGWFYTDGTSAPLGGRDLTKAITALSYDLSTPAAAFPEGNYLFRVEEYRVNYNQHYSFHQYRAYIQR